MASPKKRTDEFDLFAVKSKKANESRKKIMEALYQLTQWLKALKEGVRKSGKY